MTDTTDYTPPKVWTWTKPSGGRFENINRPIAGSTHEKELPVGRHPLQLYSQGTPNGVKVTVMLEELLALGHKGAEYDAWLIRIGNGDQFGSGFVAINPNSKIPALVDRSGPKPIRIFETGAILMYLAEKFGEFLPTEPAARVLDRDLARIVGAVPARHTGGRLDAIGGRLFRAPYQVMECRVEGLGDYGGIKRHDWTTPLLSLASGHFSLSFTQLVYSSVIVK